MAAMGFHAATTNKIQIKCSSKCRKFHFFCIIQYFKLLRELISLLLFSIWFFGACRHIFGCDLLSKYLTNKIDENIPTKKSLKNKSILCKFFVTQFPSLLSD